MGANENQTKGPPQGNGQGGDLYWEHPGGPTLGTPNPMTIVKTCHPLVIYLHGIAFL
jgi:hypothetical protein